MCRLIAPIGLMQTRLHILEVGSGHDSALARSAELDGILNDAAVEGVTSRDGHMGPVSDVALELVATVNWL